MLVSVTGLQIDRLVKQAVLIGAKLQNTVEHLVYRFLIGPLLRRFGKANCCVQLTESGDDLTAVVIE
ncbi:hypothetical protein ES703_22188 [subsurface metagenome]